MIAPAAKAAVGTRRWARFYRIGNKGFESGARFSGIGSIVSQPERGARAIAQFDMGKFRCQALNLGQQVGIEDELQDVLGMGPTFQFGIGDLVAKRSERGRPLDAFQEIRPPAPVA